jgi:hypothetical protein
MKSNFGIFVWAIWFNLLLVMGWKQRGSVPLWWRSPLGWLIVTGASILIGTVYVIWANRRERRHKKSNGKS